MSTPFCFINCKLSVDSVNWQYTVYKYSIGLSCIQMSELGFGERVAGLRSDKQMGLRELGRAVDISAMHISNLEKGKSMPSPELVTKLAAVLDGDLDELLHLADQIDPAVVEVIQSNPQSVPSFLRSAKDLTPEQWQTLQKQVDKMTKQPIKKN